jgi:DNA repair protein RadC
LFRGKDSQEDAAAEKNSVAAFSRDHFHSRGCARLGDQNLVHVTRTLREASKILQIELLDHVIVRDAKSDPQGRGFFSFREAGYL